MKTKKINWFWIGYAIFMIVIIIMTAVTLSSCSTEKSLPADWRYHKKVANVHPKLKAHKIVHCNRE